MKETVKKGLITTLTLGAIVLGAGAIIGVTSAFTSPFVVAHSEAAILASVKEVFPDADDLGTVTEFESGALSARYEARKGNNLLGWAYVGTQTNDYGEITATVAVNSDGSLGRVAITKLDQTKPDPIKEYVNGINDGSRDYTDTTGGATYGCNTIKNIIQAALDDAATLGGTSEELVLVRHVFPDATSVGDMETLSGGKLTGRYEVKQGSETIGYAYRGNASGMSETVEMLIGLKTDGSLNRIYMIGLVDGGAHGFYETANDVYVSGVNDGTRDPSDTSCGATLTADAIYALIQEAQANLKGESGENPEEGTDAGLETAKLIYSDAAKTETDIPDGIVGVTSCYKVYDASDAVIGYVYNATYELPVTETLAETSSTSEPDVETGGSDVETGGTETVPEDPYKLSLAIGINPDGTFEKAVITNVSSLFSQLVDELYIAHINETKAPEENYIPEGMMVSEAVQIAARNLNTMIYDIQEDVKPGYHDSLTGETPSTSEAGE